MIKLSRPDKPENKSDYLQILLRMSHKKCAYCEKKILRKGEADKEHFIAEYINPDSSEEWDNFLPACTACNSAKLKWNCLIEPIINPTKEIPKEHLQYFNLHFYNRNISKLGENTITCFEFNSSSFWEDKYIFSKNIVDKIEHCITLLDAYQNNDLEVNKRKLQNKVLGLLELTQPNSEYSALYATFICESPAYKILKAALKRQKLWNKEMAALDRVAGDISLA